MALVGELVPPGPAAVLSTWALARTPLSYEDSSADMAVLTRPADPAARPLPPSLPSEGPRQPDC